MAKQLLRKQREEDEEDEGSGHIRVTGAKGHAARASYQRTMENRPRPLVAAFRRRLAEQMEVPMSQLQGAALRGYFERRSPLGTHKLLTYNAFAVAKTWEHLEEFTARLDAQPVAVRDALRPSLDKLAAQVMSHATFIDQTAIDGGRYSLSWLLTGLPQPPFHITRAHTMLSEDPVSPLAEPRWIAANLSYLRDMEFVSQRTQTGQDSASSPPSSRLPAVCIDIPSLTTSGCEPLPQSSWFIWPFTEQRQRDTVENMELVMEVHLKEMLMGMAGQIFAQ
eukprot:6484904-Amphidinium_carterae.3